MKLRIVLPLLSGGLLIAGLNAQTTNYFGVSGNLNSSVWSTSPTGPYTSALNTTGGAIIEFDNVATFNGATITVAGINANANATIGSNTGTISNQGNIVIPINVGSGATLDFGSQTFTGSNTAGYIKNGAGTLALAGGTYGGGFTLNAGMVVIKGTNAMGSSANVTNTLTLNGGTLAGNSNRDLTGKYSGGITIGGDVQYGDMTTNATATLTFSNNMALGSSTRTFTLGSKGTMTFGGVISGGSGAGLTFKAVSGAEDTVSSNGVFAITGTANTFTGAVNIDGPEVTFAADGSLGNVSNTINIDGGRLTGTASFTITAGRGIQVGDTAGTSISAKGGSTVLVYNGVIANVAGKTGSWAKQGAGTLQLGGVSTYTGDTAINNGVLQLTTGNNRLPTGTTLSLGQSGSNNQGKFDLNGFSQQVAGINSVTGNATSGTNTITSATAATLTLGGSGTYSYGDSTTQNSGIITGAVALVKNGSGTQTLGGANTYTGGTTVSAGTLVAASATAFGNTTSTVSLNGGTLNLGSLAVANPISYTSGTLSNSTAYTGTISVQNGSTLNTTGLTIGASSSSLALLSGGKVSGTGTVGGGLTINSGSFVAPGNSIGTLNVAGGVTWNGGGLLDFELGSDGSSDKLAITGALTKGTGTGFAFDFQNTGTAGKIYTVATAGSISGFGASDFSYTDLASGLAGIFSLSGNNLLFTVSAVPEPATWAALAGAAGLAGAIWQRRRRKA